MEPMSESESRKHNQLSRRVFVGGVAAVVAAGVAVPAMIRTMEQSRRRLLIAWSARYAVFEQWVDLRLSRRVTSAKAISVALVTPRESLVLHRFVLHPGASIPVRLAYPYQEVVPGDYVFTASLDDEREGEATVDLAVTLSLYRFGC